MNDEDFDKILKQKIKQDKEIPDKINQLFLEFEKEEKMDKENKIINFKYVIRYVSIAACLTVVLFLGGSTYAHVKGTETWLSPMLRAIGINNKYEENATQINKEVKEENIKVKMLNAAIDNTSLIVGYEIKIDNMNLDNWVDIYGEYKVNDLRVGPISQTMDKDNEGKIVVYQIFDINEIDLKSLENVKISVDIDEIDEFTEYENLNSNKKEYLKIHSGNWKIEETIPVKNIVENKEYKFESDNKIEPIKDVNITVEDLIKGSYIDVLKITTDKTNYKGDSFEYYYKILDENKEEIGIGSEERAYDASVYTDRLVVPSIALNKKLNVDVYIKDFDSKSYQNKGTILLDCSKAEEVKKESNENTDKYIGYKTKEYTFKCNKNWKNLGIATAEDVGPNSRYKGSLRFEIPPSTNLNENAQMSIIKINKNMELEKYVKEVEKEYLSLKEAGGYTERSSNKCKVGKLDGYNLIFEPGEGETTYLVDLYFVASENAIYEINFWTSEIEHNNIKEDIEFVIQNFNIIE